MRNGQISDEEIAKEFLGMGGDPRHARRLETILRWWVERPGVGFPEIFRDDASLEGLYRLVNNPHVSFEQLLDAHSSKTLERCGQDDDETLVIQDTTTFVFSGEREGLGYINKNNRGFLGHFALAVRKTADGFAVPLGMVAARTWVRDTPRKQKATPQHKLRQSPDCESHRWRETAVEVENKFERMRKPIHVMDREGHVYDCISTMVDRGMRFVVRAGSRRIVESEDPEYRLLSDALDGLEPMFTDTVTVAPRRASKLPDQNTAFPSREGRQADVLVAATQVTLKRTRNSSSEYSAVAPVGVVHIFEPEPPEGDAPVEWILITTEPLDSEEDLRKVIDCYRHRWLIEEFNKAIKTGCAFEKRQFASYEALRKVLAISMPIAWSLLLFRTQSRIDADLPAHTMIDANRLEILRRACRRSKLPPAPTVRDVAYAVAGLGGHLKRNGPPGWQTLRRGLKRLLALEEGWYLRSTETCDQS